jgi:hypothetical protein
MLIDILSFVDRDMVMRYEWGLGIGHVYSWKNDQVAGGATLDVEEPELDEEADADSASSGTRAEDDLTGDCLDNGENEVLSEGELNKDEEGEDHDWVDEEAGSNDKGNYYY